MLESLIVQASLINFDYTGESRADFFPVDTDLWVTKFCNVQESTNIKVLIDETEA